MPSWTETFKCRECGSIEACGTRFKKSEGLLCGPCYLAIRAGTLALSTRSQEHRPRVPPTRFNREEPL